MSVVLEVPSDPEFVIVARTAIAAAATVSGATLEEVEDLRLAVSEVCSLLLDEVTGPTVRIRFDAAADAVSVGFATTLREGAGRPGSDLAWTLLEALVDDVTWNPAGPELVVLAKQVLLGAAPRP